MARAKGYLYDVAAYQTARPVDSFWEDSLTEQRPRLPSLEADLTADIAVIGGGYTGLHAALRLAEHHQRDVVLLDAGDIAWGASGRNGGFCCMGGSTLSDHQITKRFGPEALIHFEQTQIAATHFVRVFLTGNHIDADTQSDGEWQLAHRPSDMSDLKATVDALKVRHGLDAKIYPKSALGEMGMGGAGFHGAAHIPVGFALNPLKYAMGLLRKTTDAGVRLYSQSGVLAMEPDGGGYRLRTQKGSVRARQVILAMNGYGSETVFPMLAGLTLPVLSNILVTRPLSEDAKQAQGWWSDQMAYDTRHLLHYFRLLPDNRFLFGMRGGTDASGFGAVSNDIRIRRHFERMFPKWAGVEQSHIWSGFVAMTRNQMPYLGPVHGLENVWTSMAYHGNGVALASWSGKALADQMAGQDQPDKIPVVMRQVPRAFPLPSLRLWALRVAYLGYTVLDEWL